MRSLRRAPPWPQNAAVFTERLSGCLVIERYLAWRADFTGKFVNSYRVAVARLTFSTPDVRRVIDEHLP